ncbi:hypothetical protein F0267_28295 [Vibrio coralliilyticus]|uniref:Uncharacterized protein n=3 Tax=Vibrio TaxID=662 RepID=A0AAN0SH95_9VIBR|nr:MULTISPECIES: hypothetical protein [Vibrio]CAH1582920.1 conserved hypothetical protein [Vibrio jasicida]AIW22497.1 hypothetical protein IX92_25880 [Vibrio coralliilyticus]MCZ2799161.1 hypothetical protein [Vibrio alginolyticus]NOH42136.1 hypothetical protein [Vibrio coralliilyticus]PAW00785.1 hypothetical protein CKJ79_25370 [Vibrio coralliilyticus]
MSHPNNPLEGRVLADPACSFWIKKQLEATKQRDPIDALNDAELLVAILKQRLAATEIPNKG